MYVCIYNIYIYGEREEEELKIAFSKLNSVRQERDDVRIYIYNNMCIYIYIERERERREELKIALSKLYSVTQERDDVRKDR